MCLSIFVLLILSVSVVSANDNVSSDELSIDGTNSYIISGSFADLQTIIDSDTTGEINLTEDYVYSSSDSSISIDKQVTINGNNHIIDANGASTIFSVNGSNVILNNLTIKNINITSAKTNAILWNGENGNLINCNISNNYVSQFLGAIVYWNASSGTIDNCIFDNNDLSSNTAPNIISSTLVWR